MSKPDLDRLATDLADFAPVERTVSRSPKEERIIAGFEEIRRFVEERGHLPRHGENLDIFERLYAVRLDRLRASAECVELLSSLDEGGLLSHDEGSEVGSSQVDLNALAEQLQGFEGDEDITQLRHVKPYAEKRAAEEIANRQPCEDFDTFKVLFEQVQHELDRGLRETRPFKDDARINKGDWFVLHGQKALVADIGEEFVADYGRKDRRLRVIFDNSTEITMLKRSLERSLQKDKTGRRITDPSAGPLFVGEAAEAFAGETAEGDKASGTIYVLRSRSDHPVIAESRDVFHKIGVTGGDVERRIAGAKDQTTFLMADVEVVAKYELFNINRSKLEHLLHRFFSAARCNVEIEDRLGRPIKPREWFLVPLPAIDEAVKKIQDGTITRYRYDPETASLVEG